jgi:hypothetical protein
VRILIVDGANVVGSRPDGWWRDRAGAARRLQQRLAVAALPYDEVVLVVEGKARGGAEAGVEGTLRTLHAPRSGDDAIVDAVQAALGSGEDREVHVVTADHGLRERVGAAGADTRSPTWLLGQL